MGYVSHPRRMHDSELSPANYIFLLFFNFLKENKNSMMCCG